MTKEIDKTTRTWTAAEVHAAFWYAAFESDTALTSVTATTLWNLFIKTLLNYKV